MLLNRLQVVKGIIITNFKSIKTQSSAACLRIQFFISKLLILLKTVGFHTKFLLYSEKKKTAMSCTVLCGGVSLRRTPYNQFFHIMRRIPLKTFAALHAKNTPVFISILDNDSDTTNRLSHLHPLYLKYYLSQAHIFVLGTSPRLCQFIYCFAIQKRSM